jgi:hypothetical protein
MSATNSASPVTFGLDSRGGTDLPIHLNSGIDFPNHLYPANFTPPRVFHIFLAAVLIDCMIPM